MIEEASLLDRKRMGGLFGATGYEFEKYYILSQLPTWLQNRETTGLQQELWSDVELLLIKDNRYLIQIKDHKLDLGEFREILLDFGQCQSTNPSVYQTFRIVCQGLSDKVRRINNIIKRLSDIQHLSSTELDRENQKARQILDEYKLDFGVDFIINYAAMIEIDHKNGWLTDPKMLKFLFVSQIQEYFHLDRPIAEEIFFRIHFLLSNERGKQISFAPLRKMLFHHAHSRNLFPSLLPAFEIGALSNFDAKVSSPQYGDSETDIYGFNTFIPSSLQAIAKPPPPIPNFTGRVKLLDEMYGKLNTSAMIIFGIPGIGKSTILKQLAAKVEQHPVFWHEFRAGLASVDNLLLNLAQFVNTFSPVPIFCMVQSNYSVQQKASLLLDKINQAAAWLFFDSGEHIQNDPALLSLFGIFKDRLTTAKLVVASRTKLNFYRRHDEFLGIVKAINLEGLSSQETKIFLEMHGKRATLDLVQVIHERFAGHPLALELLVSLSKVDFTEAQFCETEKTIERQIQTLFVEGYRKLSSSEQLMLQISGLFNLPFSENQLLSVYADVGNGQNNRMTFDQLQTRLLISQEHSDTYQIHPIIRSFVNRYTDQLSDLRVKVATYLVESFEADIYILIDAWLLYYQANAYDKAAELAVWMFDPVTIRYHPTCVDIFLSGLKDKSLTPENKMWVFGLRGNFSHYERCYTEAQIYFEQMLGIANQLKHEEGKIGALNNLGKLYSWQSDDRAERYYLDCLEWYKQRDETFGVAETLNALGAFYIGQERFDDAQRVLNEKAILIPLLNDIDWQERSLNTQLGQLYGRQGQYEKGITHTLKAYELTKQIDGSPYHEAMLIYDLGVHHFKQENHEQAFSYYIKALELAEQYNLWEVAELSHRSLALCYESQGMYKEALSHFAEVAQIQERIGDKQKLAITYFDSGTYCWRQKNYEDAIGFYEQGLAVLEYLPDKELAADYLNNIYGLAEQSNRPRQLLNALKKLKNRLLEGKPTYLLARVYETIGKIYLKPLNRTRVSLACQCQAINLFGELELRGVQVQVMSDLGVFYEEALHRYGDAVDIYSQAIPIAKEHSLLDQLGVLLYNRGNGYAHADLPDLAKEDYLQALPIAREVSNTRLVHAIEQNLAETYRHLGEPEKAIDLLVATIKYAQQTNEIEDEIYAKNNLALAHRDSGNTVKALSLFDNALELSSQHKIPEAKIKILIGLGNFYLYDEPEKAKGYYEQALTVTRATENVEWEERSMISLAYAHREMGTFEQIQEDFETVANRASSLQHYDNLLEFTLIAGQTSFDENEMDDSVKMFVYAIIIGATQTLERTDTFEAIDQDKFSESGLAKALGRVLYVLEDAIDAGKADKAHLLQSSLIEELNSEEVWGGAGAILADIISRL